MHVYVSADIEGVAGVATPDQTLRGGYGYPRAQRLMTAETNAAIEGAFEAGAESVTVNDGHGTMDNLLQDELDPRARLITGTPKIGSMCEGLTGDFDVVFFVGYHAPAGEHGVLAHTYSGHFTGVRLNGTGVSEAEINALQAAAVDVPVALVTGDDVICRKAESAFPGVCTVAVKSSLGFSAVDSIAPAVAVEAIREGAREALRLELAPIQIPERLVLEIDMPSPTAAELAACIPTIERTSALTVQGTFEEPGELIGFLTVAVQLATDAMRLKIPLLNRI